MRGFHMHLPCGRKTLSPEVTFHQSFLAASITHRKQNKLHATIFHMLCTALHWLVKHPNKCASLSSFAINEHLSCISDVLSLRPKGARTQAGC